MEINPEIKLWKELKAGDQSAYVLIYQKYFRILFRYGQRICRDPEVIKDSIQDLFIDIWTHRKNLSETDSISFYLYASLKRRIVKNLLKEQPMGKSNEEYLLKDIDNDIEETIITQEISAERRKRIVLAMHKLSKRQHEAFELKFFHNLTNEEIAKKMAVRIETVYNLISKALSLVRREIIEGIILLILWEHLR